MRKRTTTKQLNTAITNGLLQIEKAEICNKTTRKTENISIDIFHESLEFLCESIFADSIGWYYGKDHKARQYVIECSRMDGSVDIIITVYLHVCGDVGGEDVERILLFTEEN